MALDPLRDIGESLPRIALGTPTAHRGDGAMVCNIQPQVHRAVLIGGYHFDGAAGNLPA